MDFVMRLAEIRYWEDDWRLITAGNLVISWIILATQQFHHVLTVISLHLCG